MRMQVASGYHPRGPQPPPSRAPPAAQHLEEASEGEVDTGVFAEQRQLRNRQRKLIIDVHEEVKCERRRAESQLRREGVITKDNEGNPSDAEWRAILQTVVSPGSYMDRDRRELDVMDEDRDYVEDMETAIRYGFSTIQSHLESQYAIEAPPLQARSLMHDNDEQFPQAEQLPVALDRKEGGLAAKDPRPTVTARVGDFTLPMPVFAHGELRDALTSLRNASGGASAGGARSGAVDASKKTPRGPDDRGISPRAQMRAAAQSAARAAKSKGAPLGGPEDGNWTFMSSDSGTVSNAFRHEYIRQAAESFRLRFNERWIHRESDNCWLPLRRDEVKPSEMSRPDESTQQEMKRVLDDRHWLDDDEDEDDMEELRMDTLKDLINVRGAVPLQLSAAVQGRIHKEFISRDSATNKGLMRYLIGRAIQAEVTKRKSTVVKPEADAKVEGNNPQKAPVNEFNRMKELMPGPKLAVADTGNRKAPEASVKNTGIGRPAVQEKAMGNASIAHAKTGSHVSAQHVTTLSQMKLDGQTSLSGKDSGPHATTIVAAEAQGARVEPSLLRKRERDQEREGNESGRLPLRKRKITEPYVPPQRRNGRPEPSSAEAVQPLVSQEAVLASDLEMQNLRGNCDEVSAGKREAAERPSAIAAVKNDSGGEPAKES